MLLQALQPIKMNMQGALAVEAEHTKQGSVETS